MTRKSRHEIVNTPRYIIGLLKRVYSRVPKEVRELSRAIERGEIKPYFQPIVDSKTHTVVGLEALARWAHPKLGIISPDFFIPLAEESGLINALGKSILEQTITAKAQWEAAGIPKIPVAVNVSGIQLADETFAEMVRSVFSETLIEPGEIVFEVTESVAMSSSPQIRITCEELVSFGARIMIDDFGTGYASLLCLKDLPASAIKVDRAFVNTCAQNERDCNIVGSMIELAHTLGMSVTAEGIETTEHSDHLAELGCDRLQGYLISKPIPGDAFKDWLTGYRSSKYANFARNDSD